MENYIERAGGPLPALRNLIKTDVGDLLHRCLPQITAASRPEQADVLDAVTHTLDEFFHCIEHLLFQHCRVLADERTKRQYLSDYQYTALQLLGHLLQYTRPVEVKAKHSPASFKNACCQHLYRALTRLLDYTLQLAGGWLDPNLPLPPATRTLLQEMLVDDLDALRQHLEAIQVSPALIDITLTPFRELSSAYSVTFHRVHSLRMLQQALLQSPLPGYESTGDGRVLWALVAQNFNAPEPIAYCQHITQRQLEACTSQEARRRQLDYYKTRLSSYLRVSSLAWHPEQPGVREQLSPWLDMQVRALPVEEIDSPRVVTSSDPWTSGEEPEDEEEEPYTDNSYSPDDLTLRNVSPQVFAVIADAARKLHYVFWGRDGTHLAEMVARIPSIHRLLSGRTVRRGLSDLGTLRKAREILQSIIHFLDRRIKALEEKLSR